MPTIKVQRVAPRASGQHTLWRVDVPMEVDRAVTAFGESLGDALVRVGGMINAEERAELAALEDSVRRAWRTE